MLGDGHHAAEIAVERIELRTDPVAQAVLREPHLDQVLRPADTVRELLRLAAHAVVHVGQHLGDRPHGIGRLDTVLPEELEPRKGRVVGPVALRDGIVAHEFIDEPLHERIPLRREQPPGQPCGPAVEPCGRLPRDVALRSEQQRSRGSRRSLVHAAAENPEVGHRHVGNALHGGRHSGARGPYLPPHGRRADLQTVRRPDDRVAARATSPAMS